ncbi:MAG TPA: type II toxin-antitoxin system Phd/YefM family antitoxin [Thermomicrobiales bacterium]|jgi:prevent-host-death family protein
MVKTMSAPDAQAHFTDLLGAVHETHEAVVVEQNGKAIAVVISPEDFAKLQRSAEDGWWASIQRVQDRNEDKDPDDVMRDITELVEEVRRERRARYQSRARRS